MKKMIMPMILGLSLLVGPSAFSHDMHDMHEMKGGMKRMPPAGHMGTGCPMMEHMPLLLPGVLDTFPAPPEGPCADLKLDKTQKEKLKSAYFKFEEKKIELESESKKAHLNYEKMVASPDANEKSAKEASKAIVSSMSDSFQAFENYKNEAAFGILRAEQRGPAMACMHSLFHPGPGPMGAPDEDGKKCKFHCKGKDKAKD